MRKKAQLFKSKQKKRTSVGRMRVHRHLKHLSKKPLFTVPLATFMVLLVGVMAWVLVSSGGEPKLKVNDSNVVVVNYDKEERTVPTRAKTVGELIERLEITMHPGDVVEPSRDTEIIGDNFRINVYRAVPVTIVDGNQKTFTYSAAATSRSIVKQAGIEVYPEDKLELLPTENFLTESSIGERVVIERATPVAVNLYGTPTTIRTHAKTVGELMKERGLKLAKNDSVIPSLDTEVTSATQIFLIRKGVQIQTAEVPIDMPIEVVEDASLTFGATAIRQQGAAGKKLITYQIDLQNGQEVARKVIQEVVAQEPVKQVVARGKAFNPGADKTAVMLAAGIRPADYPYVDYIINHESRWNPAAVNPRGCIGLGQNCPDGSGRTWLSEACPDWKTNPVCQLKRFSKYANDRYGGWAQAYNAKVAKGWW